MKRTHVDDVDLQVQTQPTVLVLPVCGAAPCSAVVEEALGASVVLMLPLTDNLL